ncbi:DNA-binding response regulator [Paramagnetospirillum kuznetsovii]|uniref:DNA-binding response regulator n=1 Tax=Paramagnetospirillum kuznetsovii TaxID=2053833 RepID=A0A364NXX8_9PROT|nr:response regulator [Paramagnetospirillum kuznetsovii]RAU21932.1 DNA-binding response regulator [Paramagnetospirillum kuznetsovii]
MNKPKLRTRTPVTIADVRLAERCKRGKVIVIDDDSEILLALISLIEMEGYACESYASAGAYFEAALHHSRNFPGPVCILSDVKMPKIDGLELQRRLSEVGDIPLILMSGNSGAVETISAFRAGVVDFLLKPFEADLLFGAIGKALTFSLQRQESGELAIDMAERIASLTPREYEIIRLASQGMFNRDIAAHLGIALRTVKLHRQRAMDKLGMEGLIDLGRLDFSKLAPGQRAKHIW